MSGGVFAAAGTGVSVKAVVFPACACGCAYTAHACGCGRCQGYTPNGPVRDLGTRAYAPPASLPPLRLAACRLAWWVEARLQGWRERTERGGRS